jgi:predicted CXXCH cytochrome family protein
MIFYRLKLNTGGKMFKNILPLLTIFTLLLPISASAAGRGVNASPHNLSVGGPNPAYAFDEVRVCVFCHTPHNASTTSLAPLWNRDLPVENQYQMYQSPNFNLKVLQASSMPTGASRICLSCHDGTLALNRYGGTALGSKGAAKFLTGRANLTTNLADDHPISFLYDEVLALSAHLVSPATLTGPVKLDSSGYVQCTSCHNAHDNEFGNFLVMNNGDATKPGYNPATRSPLCVTCHAPTGWIGSAHEKIAGGNGCLICHTSHTAKIAEYLLKPSNDPTCFIDGCHSSISPPASPPGHVELDTLRIASGPVQYLWNALQSTLFLATEPQRSRNSERERGADLKSVFEKQIYRHPIGQNPGTHDRKERLPISKRHVECIDCHNSHLAGGQEVPGGVKPSLKGVSGISAEAVTSLVATSEYEICFKCHSGGSAGNFVALRKANRVIQEPDQQKRFRASNPSLHPVTVDRRGRGESLLDEFRTSMIRIDCSDCHNSDESKKAGRSGPNGPHASRFEHILMARYEMPTAGGKSQSGCSDYRSRYDLCFRCHADTYVMVSGTAFTNAGVNEHTRHVVNRCIPCSACHDPHGVPMQRGATKVNNSHLINFDRDYAASRALPQPQYQSLISGRGSCTVSCHTGGTHSYAK